MLAPGDRVFAIARPDALRRLEAAVEPVDPSLAPDAGVDALSATSEEPSPTDRDGTATDETAGTAPAGTATPDTSGKSPTKATEATPAEGSSTAATEEPSAGETEPTGEAAIEGRADASSFQDLKAEFESGEADWADDVSDSPGGDMRLDE